MNGNEFQNYILGFIFYKFLSEKVTLLADDTLEGAGVLLKTTAPSSEILSNPNKHSSEWLREYEYTCNPFLMEHIQVVQVFTRNN